MPSFVPFVVAVTVIYICFYAFAAYVAHKDPQALRHLGPLHPRSPFRRRKRDESE